jgi:hypothetical protein
MVHRSCSYEEEGMKSDVIKMLLRRPGYPAAQAGMIGSMYTFNEARIAYPDNN